MEFLLCDKCAERQYVSHLIHSILSPFITHIITYIDEVHERDKYQEFLCIVLRDLLPFRPDLRVVLMSATLQTMTLVEYFSSVNNSIATPPAVIEMEGRVFPVQEFFLEHVLEITEYLGATTGNGGIGGIQVDDDEHLEAELAKLLAEQQQAEAYEGDVLPGLLQCALCGRTDFANGAEFGAHVEVCDGPGIIVGDDNVIAETSSMPGKSDEGVDFSQLEDYNVNEDVALNGYDVDDEKYLQEGSTLNPGVSKATDISEEATEEPKWDGKSPFLELEDVSGPELTRIQEDLLNQYQAMHDDEQVDNCLLLDVLKYITKSSYGDGAVLVFLPGWQEISEFRLLLENTAPFRDRGKYLILPLHSGIPSKDQRRVLQRPPPGTRKIVLSTNIAETSLTIEDVAFVVDSGKAKEKSYDPHLKTSTLQTAWISQASAKQRKGRAGRTKAGVCFHLFSSRRHASMRPFTESELLRTPLVRSQLKRDGSKRILRRRLSLFSLFIRRSYASCANN